MRFGHILLLYRRVTIITQEAMTVELELFLQIPVTDVYDLEFVIKHYKENI